MADSLTIEMRRHIEMTRAQASHSYVPQTIDDTQELRDSMAETNSVPEITESKRNLHFIVEPTEPPKRKRGRPRKDATP